MCMCEQVHGCGCACARVQSLQIILVLTRSAIQYERILGSYFSTTNFAFIHVYL